MLDWIQNFLTPPSIRISLAIWNFAMDAVSNLLQDTPWSFSGDTWTFVNGTLYPWMLSIGLSLLNLFIMIALFQTLTNLHMNVTLELCVEVLIKIVAANVIFLNLSRLMRQFFRIARLMCVGLDGISGVDLELTAEDAAANSGLLSTVIGLLFVLVSIVCSFMILLAVYGRFIKLYLLVVMAPLATVTVVGGRGVEHTFYAFLKTFLLNVFEIVVIQIILIICTKLMQSGINIFDDTTLTSVLADLIGVGALNAMFTMILSTAMIKGANRFFEKAFGL